MSGSIVTVVGGSGFIGRYVVKELAQAGYTVRVLCRHPESGKIVKPAGSVGQIVVEYANITKPETLEGKLNNSFAVVNLVGVLYEKGRQNFSQIHAQGAERLAKLAKQAGAKRFVQISALGIDKPSNSKYAHTKDTGEKAVRAAFPDATILRPSVVFGPEDNFFNQFAAMACISPVLPLIGGGKTKFQPVYVADVARAVAKAVRAEGCKGKTYELGGPEEMNFRQILEYIMRQINRPRMLANIPFPLASMKGFFFELIPFIRPPLTRDQVRSLKQNNVLSGEMPGFAELGIKPKSIEAVVPTYLKRYKA